MSIIVQKYGGSSLADAERFRAVAGHVLAAREQGHDVVVVVSAMGDTTRQLLDRADAITDSPPLRELDILLGTGEQMSMSLLAMALRERGAEAVSLTGGQCGIRTDGCHFSASIESVEPERIRRELDHGRIVVAAGYQGLGPGDELTTLGLGGSDTTGVALAAALDAERCDICTDVDGVYSADPRVVPDARRIDELSHTEMVELARHGAGVLNPRSIEYARDHGVEVHVRSSFEPERPGTVIRDLSRDGEPRAVGIASHDALVPVTVTGDDGGAARTGDRVLDALGRDDVFLDRTRDGGSRRDLLIPAEDIADPEGFTERVTAEHGDSVRVLPERGSVSAIGLGLGRHDPLAAAPRRDAEEAGISLLGHYRDRHAVTCVVPTSAVTRTMNLFHDRLREDGEAAA